LGSILVKRLRSQLERRPQLRLKERRDEEFRRADFQEKKRP